MCLPISEHVNIVGKKVSMSVLTKDRVSFFLDFVHHVTDVERPNYYVTDAGSAFVFRQEAPTLLDTIDRAILSHWVPTSATLTSVEKKKIVSVCSTILG